MFVNTVCQMDVEHLSTYATTIVTWCNENKVQVKPVGGFMFNNRYEHCWVVDDADVAWFASKWNVSYMIEDSTC